MPIQHTFHHSRRGGIISALLTFFAVGIVLCVLGGFYIANNVHVQTTHGANGDNVAIDVPGGRLKVRANDHMSPASLGAPLYPGAVRQGDKTGGASITWASREGDSENGLAVAAGEYITNDSAEKVTEWYHGQLPNWLVVTDDDGLSHFELKDGGYRRVVGIRRKHDGTHISVASIGEPASN